MLEFLLHATPASALVVVCFTALAVVGATAVATQLVARTLPARVLSAVRELTDRLDQTESLMRRMEGEWAVTQENLEALEESVERKRRRIAASASRAKQLEAEADERDQAPADPQAQLIALRQRVYGVPGGIRGGA